jgi:hypothetical protein
MKITRSKNLEKNDWWVHDSLEDFNLDMKRNLCQSQINLHDDDSIDDYLRVRRLTHFQESQKCQIVDQQAYYHAEQMSSNDY